MEYIFLDALAFNQPIGNWDTSSVATMDYMFDNATVFSQDISLWNVANVVFHEFFADRSALASIPSYIPVWCH